MAESPRRHDSTLLPPPVEGVPEASLYRVVFNVVHEGNSYESGNWTPTIPAPPPEDATPSWP